jgi:protein-arginine kinase activator protein McsA
MKAAARNLEFEKAAMIRDRISELRKDEELTSPIAKR